MHINLFGLRIGIFTKQQLQQLESFAMSEVDKAVIAAKQTPLGSQIANLIKDVKDQQLSGAEKFELVVKDAIPIIDGFLTGAPGHSAGELGDFARQLVQSVYNDVLSTKAAATAKFIFSLLKSRLK